MSCELKTLHFLVKSGDGVQESGKDLLFVISEK